MKSPWVFDVGEQEFEEKVLARSKEKPVIVDFWAPWCGPCRSLAPLIEKQIAQRNGDVLLAKVNIDEEQNLAYRYNVQSIPLVVGLLLASPGALVVSQLLGANVARLLVRRQSPIKHAFNAAVSALDVMVAMGWFVAGGICERFPELTVVFLEGSGGWCAPMLERFDHHVDVFGSRYQTTPPSEVFKRQCYISFDPDEEALA